MNSGFIGRCVVSYSRRERGSNVRQPFRMQSRHVASSEVLNSPMNLQMLINFQESEIGILLSVERAVPILDVFLNGIVYTLSLGFEENNVLKRTHAWRSDQTNN